MVFGIFRHIYQYYVSNDSDPPQNSTGLLTADNKVEKRPATMSAIEAIVLLPLYDKAGKHIGFVTADYAPVKSETAANSSFLSPQTSGNTEHKVNNSTASLATPQLFYLTDNGIFAPYTSKSAAMSSSEAQKIATHVEVSKVAVPPQHQKPLGDDPLAWDGWPDGNFEADYSHAFVTKTLNLRCHWATRICGGDRRGSDHASDWRKGKKSTRECLGVIQCNNKHCQIIIRPKTRSPAIAKQLEHSCSCGASLSHHQCNVRSTLMTWYGGVHYINGGFHNHDRLSHALHLLPHERSKFEEIVSAHPNIGPLGLIVGVPGLKGPGESVANISNVLINADHVQKEKGKLKKSGISTGDDFIQEFAQFERDHPDFVVYSQFGAITVVSLQSPFMASQLVQEDLIEGPLNGMVVDAAHGWWQKSTSLLIISSFYSPELLRWVPGIFSYTNGATADHYTFHFLSLFQRISSEIEERKLELLDRHFVGVADFSEAEHVGFCQAFVQFWSTRVDNYRTAEQLEEAAKSLLRGCIQHFRAGVTRIKRISGVVPPHQAEAFQWRVLSLLSATDGEIFQKWAEAIIHDFPMAETWLNWWMRPSHASMLFSSQQKMDPEIWDSIPDSTNAEEAMHFKLYCGAGKNHEFLEGMFALYSVAKYYECIYAAEMKGTLIRYGKAEPWKAIAQKIGRTKPSRAPGPAGIKRKQNDGRPPDTAKELLKPPAKKIKTTKNLELNSDLGVINDQIVPFTFGPPSYPWKDNSCWLDSSLELLYTCIIRNFDDFALLCGSASHDSGIWMLYSIFSDRHSLDYYNNHASTSLGKQRDLFWKFLKQKGAIAASHTLKSFDSLLVWLGELLKKEKATEFYASLFFQVAFIEIHQCSGSSKTGGNHVEITETPYCCTILQVGDFHHKKYNGSIENWAQDFFALEQVQSHPPSCWHSKGGKPLCSGKRVDINNMVISIPVIFSIEVGDEFRDDEDAAQAWDFPASIIPHTNHAAQEHALIYDLVGHALVGNNCTHFTARYCSSDSNTIYTYDGMEHGGIPIQDLNAKFMTHISGKKIVLPAGYSVYQAFYCLRGGLTAQKKFYELRSKEYNQLYGLQFCESTLGKAFSVSYKSPGLKEMPKKNRTWLSSPQTAYTTEYLIFKRNKEVAMSISDDSVPESEEENFTLKDSLQSQSPACDIKVDITEESSPPITVASLPDSLFSINCRCGLIGDGNILYHEDDGEAIQCNNCNEWSHIACQINGRASNLRIKESFTCDICSITHFAHQKERTRTSERKKIEARTGMNLELRNRLRAGRGALAQNGEFWYPVRLIQKETGSSNWKVCWWRENRFSEPTVEAGSTSTVKPDSIVDSLWGNRTERRKIRLGTWKHSWDIESSEDILSNPSSIPFTKEVANILSPAQEILRKLLLDPGGLKGENIPAKAWLLKNEKSLTKTIIPYAGSLLIIERAQIANWFEAYIVKDKKARQHWMGRLPLAHAFTIFIASHLKNIPKYTGLDQDSLIQKAWKAQFTETSSVLVDVDVDKQCLEMLEEEMFEKSARAGIAGHFQWGLDAGDHQDDWDPYAGRPTHWDHEDRHGSEGELERGWNYIKLERLKVKEDPAGHSVPKPRPLKRKRD